MLLAHAFAFVDRQRPEFRTLQLHRRNIAGYEDDLRSGPVQHDPLLLFKVAVRQAHPLSHPKDGTDGRTVELGICGRCHTDEVFGMLDALGQCEVRKNLGLSCPERADVVHRVRTDCEQVERLLLLRQDLELARERGGVGHGLSEGVELILDVFERVETFLPRPLHDNASVGVIPRPLADDD